MKKISVLILLCLLAVNLKAQETYIQVWLSSGTQVQYKLSERPRVVRDAQTLRLTTSTVDVVYNAGEVHKITYLLPTEVNTVSSGKREAGTISFSANQMQLIGFEPAETIRIFDAAGRLRTTATTSVQGSLTIPLNALPAGTYIVRSKYQSYKFIRK